MWGLGIKGVRLGVLGLRALTLLISRTHSGSFWFPAGYRPQGLKGTMWACAEKSLHSDPSLGVMVFGTSEGLPRFQSVRTWAMFLCTFGGSRWTSGRRSANYPERQLEQKIQGTETNQLPSNRPWAFVCWYVSHCVSPFSNHQGIQSSNIFHKDQIRKPQQV